MAEARDSALPPGCAPMWGWRRRCARGRDASVPATVPRCRGGGVPCPLGHVPERREARGARGSAAPALAAAVSRLHPRRRLARRRTAFSLRPARARTTAGPSLLLRRPAAALLWLPQHAGHRSRSRYAPARAHSVPQRRLVPALGLRAAASGPLSLKRAAAPRARGDLR